MHFEMRLEVTEESELLVAQVTVMRLITYSSSSITTSSVIHRCTCVGSMGWTELGWVGLGRVWSQISLVSRVGSRLQILVFY